LNNQFFSKMARGGARENAGRKPIADEVKRAEKMEAVMGTEEVLENLAKKVREGDVQAIKLWLAYLLGQPKKTIDHQNDGGRFERLEIVYVEGE